MVYLHLHPWAKISWRFSTTWFQKHWWFEVFPLWVNFGIYHFSSRDDSWWISVSQSFFARRRLSKWRSRACCSWVVGTSTWPSHSEWTEGNWVFMVAGVWRDPRWWGFQVQFCEISRWRVCVHGLLNIYSTPLSLSIRSKEATLSWNGNVWWKIAKQIYPFSQYTGVSKNRGTLKWMVYNGNPIKMDDLGVPLFSETSIRWTSLKSLNSDLQASFFFTGCFRVLVRYV